MVFSVSAIQLRPSSTIRLLFLCSSSSSFIVGSSTAIGANINSKNRCVSSPFSAAANRKCFTTTAIATSSSRMGTSGTLEGASDVQSLVSSIHASPTAAVLYTTGGASSTVSALLSVPGASSTVLDAGVPYSRAATMELIGHASLKSLASEEAALALANAAFRRASYLASPDKISNLVGVGAACALATSRARRGDDRAHVAVVTNLAVKTYAIYFAAAPPATGDEEKAGRRMRQERAASRLALYAFSAVGADITDTISIAPEFVKAALIDGDEYEESSVRPSPDLLESVLSEKIPYAQASNFGKSPLVWTAGAMYARVILPGSFNPVHIGHRRLLEAAVDYLRSRDGGLLSSVTGAYELSVRNADKPPLSADVVRRRLREFIEEERVIVSNAPLFTEKAALYPTGTTFVVGYDTAIRLVLPKYYGGTEEMIRSFVKIAMKGCSFLVGARYDSNTGKVRTLDDIEIPPVLKDLFAPIPVGQFREDISSTEIRATRSNPL